MTGSLLVVIAVIHGAASVATHQFGDSLTCTVVARDMMKQKEVEAAKCVLPLSTAPKGDKLKCCTER